MTLYTAYQESKRGRRTERAMEERFEIDEELRDTQRAQQREEAARARRSQVREARVRQASVANVAGAVGAVGSSAPMAASGGVASQFGENIGMVQSQLGFMNQVGDLQGQLARIDQDIFNIQQPSSTERFTRGALQLGAMFLPAPGGGGGGGD